MLTMRLEASVRAWVETVGKVYEGVGFDFHYVCTCGSHQVSLKYAVSCHVSDLF